MKKINCKKYLGTAAVCLAILLAAGCGYKLAPQGEYIDKRIQKVYVESFSNKTALAEIENFVRTAFINRFIQHSRFKVVGSADAADATVKGAITHYNTAALSYHPNKLAAEERITVTLEIVFREKESGKIIWSANGIQGYADYKLGDDINLMPPARKNALTKLANDVAERTVNLMLAGF